MRDERRILLVDDEEHLLRSLNAYLQRRGFVVTCAADGSAARAALANGEYCAVLLDLLLPKAHGFELVREAKEKQPQARCLVMTGALDIESLNAAVTLHGADALLAKPFDLTELMQHLTAGGD